MTRYLLDQLWNQLAEWVDMQMKWFQYAEVGLLLVVYLSILIVGTLDLRVPESAETYLILSSSDVQTVLRGTLPPVVVGSIIGVLPFFLFEILQYRKRPFVTQQGEVNVIEYPSMWVKKSHTFPEDFDALEHLPRNMIGVSVDLRNEGLAVAEDCRVQTESNRSSTTYPSSWTESNKRSIDLAPGEHHRVDLFWIDRITGEIWTPSPGAGNNTYYPFSEYPKTIRADVPHGEHKITLEVIARDMGRRTMDIFPDGIRLPDGIKKQSDDWDVVETIKAEEDVYAIERATPEDEEKDVLEVPEGMDLNRLSGLIEIPDSQSSGEFDTDLKRMYSINEIEGD